MSVVLKSLFNFSQTKQRDLEISNKLFKIQGLIRDLEKQKHHDLPFKLKTLLNTAFLQQKGESLFELLSRSASRDSPVEWVPSISKAVSLLSAGSTFMRVVIQAQDYKIPIEVIFYSNFQKSFIPNYLFKNNLLNENSGYQSISNSISGLMVPLIDYVFIRLLHAIQVEGFSMVSKDPNAEYDSDDIYFYMSRNPYLLLLRNYFNQFASNEKHLRKLVGNVKMFFVDQILLKHRINKSTTYLKDFSFFSDKCKIRPQHLLVIYLLLKKGRVYFDEKDLFFYELIERYQSLIQTQNQIFFRFLFRIFLFAYSKNSVQNRVLDQLEKANEKDGVFDLQRYSTSQFDNSLSSSDKREKSNFNQSKTLLLKLLQRDQNLIYAGKVHFSIIRTLGCFLYLQIAMNGMAHPSSSVDQSDPLRIGSEMASLQSAIQKVYRQTKIFLKKQAVKSDKSFSKENEQRLKSQVIQLGKLYQRAYGRKIDFSKFQDHKETHSTIEFGIKGNSEDFTYSVQTYKQEFEQNCWKVPLKQSEYEILYNLFYGIAKKIDSFLPGSKPGQQPRINLRYFSNPFVFMITMLALTILFKIIF